MLTSASTMSGSSRAIASMARAPSPTVTTSMSSFANASSTTRWIVVLSSASSSVWDMFGGSLPAGPATVKNRAPAGARRPARAS